MTHRRKNFIAIDEGFTCEHCHLKVAPLRQSKHTRGKSYRNHCPFCLYSLHVDAEVPGDRASPCGGLMKPVGLESGSRKGYLGMAVAHECVKCKKRIKNLLDEGDAWKNLKKIDGTVKPGLKAL